ncbi:MAG TPA: type II toxin-antitoxin system VapC family toxin [Longimicrobiales bacterium]|nr:type II toxin-antitoxin system VapC family toxin [Longimicrobiales bacterium]
MILADTSIWVAHLRSGVGALVELLEQQSVLMHPMVVGELACGNLRNRPEILEALQLLPPAPVATHEEALGLIERKRLMGRGIGYIDVHLLASSLLAGDARLWTTDARLASAAARLFIAFDPAR